MTNDTKQAMADNAKPDQPKQSGFGAELTGIERAALAEIEHAGSAFKHVLISIEQGAVGVGRGAGHEMEVAKTKILEAMAWARKHVTG